MFQAAEAFYKYFKKRKNSNAVLFLKHNFSVSVVKIFEKYLRISSFLVKFYDGFTSPYVFQEF